MTCYRVFIVDCRETLSNVVIKYRPFTSVGRSATMRFDLIKRFRNQPESETWRQHDTAEKVVGPVPHKQKTWHSRGRRWPHATPVRPR